MSSYQLVENLGAPLSEDIGCVHCYIILHNPNSGKEMALDDRVDSVTALLFY